MEYTTNYDNDPGTRYVISEMHSLLLSTRYGNECFTIAPPYASDGFKTDSALFLPHSHLFCWSDLFMWMLL